MITEDDQKNLLFVQYDEDSHPFGVVTAGATNDHHLHWDFEWSKAFEYSLYHLSGCGGKHQVAISDFCQKIPLTRFWARDDLRLVRYVSIGEGGRYYPCNQKQWEAMGNVRIASPLVADPFDDAQEGEAVFCRTCKDWLPNEDWNYCEHLAWCEKCEEVVHVLKSGHVGWYEYRAKRKRHKLRNE